MSLPQERRRYPRMSTGSEYQVHLWLGGREATQVQLKDLSACGCGLQVGMEWAQELTMGDPVERLYLDHPDLPWIPFGGVVVRILGKVPGKTTGYALVGINFEPITPFVIGLIDDHVRAQTG